MLHEIQKRIYQILETAEEGDNPSRFFDIFIISLIILNVIAVILESVAEIQIAYQEFFIAFEILSVGIFSVEYMLRLWTCKQNPEYQAPLVGRIRFALAPLALIDLFAILPFYLPLLIPLDLRFIRVFRLVRIFRILKMARYSNAINLLGRVVKKEKAIISIIFFILVLILIIASSLMYYAEKDVQPEVFSNIPSAMWWGIVTLTTVGYGDVYPVTFLGKVLGTLIAVLGIGMFALPAGVLASGFMEEIQKENVAHSSDSPDSEITTQIQNLVKLYEFGYITNEEFELIEERIKNYNLN